MRAGDSRQISIGPRSQVTARDTPATWRPRIEYGTADDCSTVQNTGQIELSTLIITNRFTHLLVRIPSCVRNRPTRTKSKFAAIAANVTSRLRLQSDFYRAMHFSAKRGLAIACRPSVRLSVRPSVCKVGGLCSHKLEMLVINCTGY